MSSSGGVLKWQIIFGFIASVIFIPVVIIDFIAGVFQKEYAFKGGDPKSDLYGDTRFWVFLSNNLYTVDRWLNTILWLLVNLLMLIILSN